MINLKHIVSLAAMMFAAVFLNPASANNAQAVWQDKDIKFWYSGFNTYYNCDALEQKLEALLLEFGAQEGAKVRARGAGCAASNVSKSISVKAQFSVPVFVASDAPESNSGKQNAFSASIQEVHVKANQPHYINRSDCEVIETFVRELLPSFEHRIHNAGGQCIKGRTNYHEVKIRASVLKVAPKVVPISEQAQSTT